MLLYVLVEEFLLHFVEEVDEEAGSVETLVHPIEQILIIRKFKVVLQQLHLIHLDIMNGLLEAEEDLDI
jgi:hypothetical protein